MEPHGLRLKKIQEELGLTNKELAKELCLSEGTLTHIKYGKRKLSQIHKKYLMVLLDRHREKQKGLKKLASNLDENEESTENDF